MVLENDRRDILISTNEILKQQERSHGIELEAVKASAARQMNEALLHHKQETNRQMKVLFQALCTGCQQKIQDA